MRPGVAIVWTWDIKAEKRDIPGNTGRLADSDRQALLPEGYTSFLRGPRVARQ